MQQHDGENIRLSLIENRKIGFELLVTTYSSLFYGRALKRLGNEDDAKEAIQQLWMKAYASLLSFTNERIITLKIENWLNTIATHVFVDVYKKRANEPTMISIQRDILGENPTVTISLLDTADLEEMQIENDLHEQLLQAITLLPETARTVVFLHYIGHYKEVEIATLLGIPESSVKSYIRRSKPVLLRELRKQI